MEILISVDNIMSKILIFIVIFFFSIGISGIGELSEYTLDTLFNMDTQSGGLKDTMQDMIDALVGTFIMIIYYYKK